MITVLGANGFIGAHLVRQLASLGKAYRAPLQLEELKGRNLGNVIYCIGLTADFRERPLDTVEAHVCKLLEIISHCRYQKIVYLSSTRIYNPTMKIAEEDSYFQVNPDDPSDLYNISKLMGEALIYTIGDSGHIVRLSNVYGRDLDANNFLSRIIRDALTKKRVILETTMDSEKDYINVDDVVNLLIQIATRGSKRVYNIASGVNTSNREIMDRLSFFTGCDIEVKDEVKTIKFPPVSINLIQSEFDFKPSNLLSDMENLIKLYES